MFCESLVNKQYEIEWFYPLSLCKLTFHHMSFQQRIQAYFFGILISSVKQLSNNDKKY